MSYSVNVSACSNISLARRADEDYQNFEHLARWLNGYMGTLCVILGTIGNLHGIKVVQSTHLDKNRGVALAVSMITLAVWDTMLLWSAFFYYGLKKLPGFADSEGLTVITPWFHGLSQMTNTASIWCVVTITLQRLRATMDPFRTTNLSLRKSTILHSFRSDRRISANSFMLCSLNKRLFRMPILLSLWAVAINLPAMFEVGTKVCYKVAERRLSIDLYLRSLRQNPSYMFWYKFFFRAIVITIGPNLVILLMTLITIYLLHRSGRSRRQLFHMSDSLLDKYSSRETMQTFIAMTLVGKFLILRSPCFLLDVFEMFGVFESLKSITVYYFIEASNFLVQLNSATNCLIFLKVFCKGSHWLNNKIVERKTMKRKKTICENGQIFGDRLYLLTTSWQKAQEMTNNQIGLRVLYSMLRKHPALFDIFRTQNGFPFGQQVEAKEVPANGCPVGRHSLDLITNTNQRKNADAPGARYQEVADRITAFIGEILEMMSTGQSEQYIVLRIRRVGAVHFDKGIHFPSSVWREFKTSLLSIVAECEFDSPQERGVTLEAWGTFTSLIIREMKMGTWAIGDAIGSMS